MIYDLIVIGNGLAAQTFLFELFTQLKSDVNKSQIFNVAQIYSEEIAPSCSLRTTATVSLSGIEEGISDLGDELSLSFKLFCEFNKRHAPKGVEEIDQYLTYSNEIEKEKMYRRYKKLELFSHPLFKSQIEGIKLQSYILSPSLYMQWFNERNYKLSRIKNFVRSILKNEEKIFECTLLSGEIVKTKKIVLCTGAYSKIYSDFMTKDSHYDLKKTQVVAGTYLEREIDLKQDSFYITLDGHNLIYRKLDKKLVIGSSSTKGAFLVGDHSELNNILDLFNERLNFSLGKFSDFKITTGLRHKAPKRRPIMKALDNENTFFMISGFYKNGFSFGHLAAQTVVEKIFNQL